jgi:predicted metal-dependent phosphoesterase TrpH
MALFAKITTMIDLHTHSTASDSDYSPEELIQEAEKRSISAIALTDHDTLGGLERAERAAKEAGIRFIPGIEVSINWACEAGALRLGPGGEMHLLGLGLVSPTPAFLNAIADLASRREARNKEILSRMNDIGIPATWDEVLAISGGYSIGRPHFASLLVEKRIVKNREQAFARYLRRGKPLFVPKVGISFDESAALISESGGIPVLAHPMSLYVAWGQLPDLVKTLKTMGLKGIEAWHPTAKPASCRRLEALGSTLGLRITEGSDFHGASRSERQLGCSNKGRKINDTVLEAIPELC